MKPPAIKGNTKAARIIKVIGANAKMKMGKKMKTKMKTKMKAKTKTKAARIIKVSGAKTKTKKKIIRR